MLFHGSVNTTMEMNRPWNPTARDRYKRPDNVTQSDVTDQEWALIEPMLPRTTCMRAVFNAIPYSAATAAGHLPARLHRAERLLCLAEAWPVWTIILAVLWPSQCANRGHHGQSERQDPRMRGAERLRWPEDQGSQASQRCRCRGQSACCAGIQDRDGCIPLALALLTAAPRLVRIYGPRVAGFPASGGCRPGFAGGCAQAGGDAGVCRVAASPGRGADLCVDGSLPSAVEGYRADGGAFCGLGAAGGVSFSDPSSGPGNACLKRIIFDSTDL